MEPKTGGFEWEIPVVASEIAGALGLALWLMQRRGRRARDLVVLGGSSTHGAQRGLQPLLRPRGCASLAFLLYYRLIAAVFYACVQCYDVYRTRARCMAFYTSWNFIAQGVYFALAYAKTRRLAKQQQNRSLATASRVKEDDIETALLGDNLSVRRASSHADRSANDWISLELLLDVCLATSLLISFVVWTILYPYAVKIHHPETILNGVSYFQHGLNVLLLQIDFFCTQHHVSLKAVPLIMIWPSLYALFAWLLHGTIAKGFWPYPFLQVDTPWAPLWYGGILVAHLLFFGLVWLVSRVKQRLQDQANASPGV